MTLGARTDAALDNCYQAIVSPDLWPDALQRLAASINVACLMFYARNPDPSSHDPRNPNRSFELLPASRGYQALLEEYVANQWYLNHYRAERGTRLLDSGQSIVLEHDLASDEERKRLSHYNDLYLRFGFPGFAMTGLSANQQLWAVTMLRNGNQGHFQQDDVPLLATLNHHFRRMILYAESLAVREGAAALQAFDASGTAAFLLGSDGSVLRHNQRAQRLLGDGLLIVSRHLLAADVKGNRELASLIHKATARVLPSAVEGGLSAVIPRGERRPLLAEAMPTTGMIVDAFAATSAIVLVFDMEERPRMPEKRLSLLFGLTPAEARVASMLIAGDDVLTIAERTKITSETARAHVKAILSKSQTHKQSEFVALASRLLPGGRGEPA
ncbi:response regulator transcription factor [Rhizobium sp. R693]|uniref:helix-turn-helix transcriptional regulator n=1 Tax=Rhizobium sp. R693 TaxID=1764276 RepID=UPI0011304101|nr:response regulator transcription factor [Rhizobium sp. R693]